MSAQRLTKKQHSIALEALRFLVDSQSLENEFDTRLGVSEAVAKKILQQEFEEYVAANQFTDYVFSNALNEIINGLFFSEKDWLDCFDFAIDDATTVLKVLNTGAAHTTTIA